MTTCRAWQFLGLPSSRRLPERLCYMRQILRRLVVDAVRLMRHDAGAQISPHHLEETVAHQVGAERDAQIDDPARPFELRRDLVWIKLVDVDGAERANHAGEQR